MSGETFAPGDRVQYRGGGPMMHVISVSSHLCYCNWVDDFGALQQGTFDQRHLVHAAPPDSGQAPLGADAG